MKNNPAGWYRNLGDLRQHGYWDGDAWVDPHDADPAAEPPDAENSEMDADDPAT